MRDGVLEEGRSEGWKSSTPWWSRARDDGPLPTARRCSSWSRGSPRHSTFQPLLISDSASLCCRSALHRPPSQRRSLSGCFAPPRSSSPSSSPLTSLLSLENMADELKKILELVQDVGRVYDARPARTSPPPASDLVLPPLRFPPTPDLVPQLKGLGVQALLAEQLQRTFEKHVRNFKSSVLEAYRHQGPALLTSLSSVDQLLGRAPQQSNHLLERLARSCSGRFGLGLSHLQGELERRVKSRLATSPPKPTAGFTKVSCRLLLLARLELVADLLPFLLADRYRDASSHLPHQLVPEPGRGSSDRRPHLDGLQAGPRLGACSSPPSCLANALDPPARHPC